MKTRDIVAEFLAEITPGRSESTIKGITRITRRLVFLCPKWPVQRADMVAWRKRRMTEVNNTTVEFDRGVLSQFFRWAMDVGYLERNPLRGMSRLPIARYHRTIITPDMYEAFKANANKSAYPMRYLMILAWNTGHRLIDLCLLRWENLSDDMRVVTFKPRKTARTGLVVELPVTDELHAAFKGMGEGAPKHNYICPTLAYLYLRNNGNTIAYEFRKIAAAVGYPSVKLHNFRHTKATRMGAANISDIDAATTLGMTNLNTLKRYKTVTMENKLKALQS